MGGYDYKHAGLWNASSAIVKGGFEGGPVILFNLTQQGNNDTLVLSPFSRFMDTSLAQTNKPSYSSLDYNVIGSMTQIPANSMHSFIVFYSSQGVNKAVRE